MRRIVSFLIASLPAAGCVDPAVPGVADPSAAASRAWGALGEDGSGTRAREGSGDTEALEQLLRERFAQRAGPHAPPPPAAMLPAVSSATPVDADEPPALPETAPAFRLEPFQVHALATRVIAPAISDPTGYAAGVGLLDADGDGDLDLFVGRSRGVDPPPCVLRNISSPGTVAFEVVPAWCFPEAVEDVSGMAIDIERDGVHELVLTGFDGAWLVRLHPTASIEPLPAPTPGDGARCPLSTGAPLDLDLDGVLDLLLTCIVRADIPRSRLEYAPHTLLGDGAGGFTPVDPATLGPLGADMNTLAAAVLDADDDGLPDVLLAVDTFSNPRSRNRLMRPGGVYYRCPPFDDAGCVFEELPFLPDVTTYGSYMGIAVLRADGQRALYLADWGYNRLLPMVGRAPWHDVARERSAADGGAAPAWHFTWGVMSEDFDANGQDDLLIAQGCVPGLRSSDCPRHYDLALTQRPDGRFRAWATAVGLPPHSVPDGSTGGFGWSSRAWLRADLDLDGTLELIEAPYAGTLRFYRLRSDDGTPWCTLVPHPRYVAGFGWGYATGPTPDGPWDERHVQGLMRTSPNPWIETRMRSGYLRFASGAVVPWTCAGGDRVDVREPEWLDVAVERAEGLLARITTRGAISGVTAWGTSGPAGTSGPFAVEAPTNDVTIELPDSAERILVQVDGRWVAQWFLLQPAE